MDHIEGIDLAKIREGSVAIKTKKTRRGLAVIKAILVKIIIDGIMKPGETITSRAVAEAIWETPARTQFWPNVVSAEGLAKAVGDLLGRHGLNLSKEGSSYILPDFKEASPVEQQ